MKELKFGANYVPSKSWFYSWVDFEKSNVEEDFCALKEMGLDHLRVHLRWDLFQPAPAYVPRSMLNKLVDMLDAAEKVGLRLVVSVLTGWMSGLWFLPAFTYPHAEHKDIFSDRKIVEAEKYLLQKIAEAVGGHAAFAGIDLGNEMNVFHMHYIDTPMAQSDDWLMEMSAYCRELFPNKLVTFGADHNPWFRDVQFSRKCLANAGTITSLHDWTKFTGALEFGAESTENLSLLEYNVELANAYGKDVGREVWVQEFGTIKEWMPEEQFENFIKSSMKNACRSDNLKGFTIWCSHEFDECFVGEDWEARLGVLTKDNKLKPLGKWYKEAIEEIKRGELAPTLKTGKAIVIDESVPFDGWKYGRAFADFVRKGEHVRFVLSSKADDKGHLNERKIHTLVTL